MTNDHPNAAAPGQVDERVFVDLAQVLAHRIRGLVASIEGFTDLLTDTLYAPDQRDLALRIFEGASRIEQVLADLQRYGQPVEPVLLPLHVTDVTNALLAPLDDADRERVTLTVEEELGLRADPYLIRQALLLLVQNALDATRHGGAVRLVVRGDGERVRFDVWNDGVVGVEDAAEQVFAPFFTTKAHNLGVGLPLARRIVGLHGGEVVLSANDAERGTCFTLTLPAEPLELVAS